ncbi:hypothetical protein BGZ65_005795, partial [Modicella reniformis]
MSDADLNLPTIVPLLQSKAGDPEVDVRQPPPTSSQPNASIAQHPHLVPASLKVETVLLTKELAKFRACDQSTCFYCREWAQWVFKKTFGKDKDKVSPVIDKKGGGGRSGGSGANSGNATSGSEPKKKHKEYAMVVCERFYQRSATDCVANGHPSGASGAGSIVAVAIAASKAGTGTGPAPSFTGSSHEGFVPEIIDTVQEWIQQPSALYTSPEVFSLVDFEALYTTYPLQNQEQNQQQDDVTPILSTITIEKAHMILGHQGYPLLKRVTKAQLQNQIVSPTCQHIKGHSKTPTDLEMEREQFNEELNRMRMRDQEGLRKQIGPVWKHVEGALERMEGAEKVRSGILGPSRAKEFVQTHKDRLVSFQEIWANVETAVKKPSLRKKGATSDNTPSDLVEEADRGFQQFIDNMQYIHKQLVTDVLESSEKSLREFIKELAAAQTKILKLALTRIQEGKVGTARIDKILEESPEKCRNALKMVEQLIPIFDTKMGQFRVLVLNKLKEVDEEVEAVAVVYLQDSQKTVQGRLEKVANKDFRRRIKKLEFLSIETRKWFFQSRLTLFSSLDFATVCLNTLGILMEEAEVLEAVQLGLHDDHFHSRVLKLQEGRLKLAQQFREGVKTGRRVLAVMTSRLMMREGARAMGEMAAIQKEKKFLKSIGQDVGDTRFNSKDYFVPIQDVTPNASAQVSDDEEADGAPVSKNKKKKDKKKKKAEEAAAAVATIVSDSDAAAKGSSGAVSGLVRNAVAEPLAALSSKEVRELKKQAKRDAKRQAKEVTEAEDVAAVQAAAKQAQEEQRAKEMEEALKAIERQEAKELKEKEEAELARQRRAAEEALEAEAARVKKAVERAEARRKAQEAKELIEAAEKERTAQKLKEPQQAQSTKDAAEKGRTQKPRESQQTKSTKDTPAKEGTQKPKESQAKSTKEAAEKERVQKSKENQPGGKSTHDLKETAVTTSPAALESSASATGWDATSTSSSEWTASSNVWDDMPAAASSEQTAATTGCDEKPKVSWAKLLSPESTDWEEKPKATSSESTGWNEKSKGTSSEQATTTTAWVENPKVASSESTSLPIAWAKVVSSESTGWEEKPKPKATSSELTGWNEKSKGTSSEQATTTPVWVKTKATSSESTGWGEKSKGTSSEQTTTTPVWVEKPKTTSSESTGWGEISKGTSSEQTTTTPVWVEKPKTTSSESTGWGEISKGTSSEQTTTTPVWVEKPKTTS